MTTTTTPLHIGWAETDITPQELPVYIAGQFYIRVSEGIQDPLKATALALESNGEHVVFVSVDSLRISDSLRDAVRAQLSEVGLDPQKIILNATHTHEAPNNLLMSACVMQVYDNTTEEIDIGFKSAQSYVTFAAQRIAEAVSQAWQNRAPGGIAFGQDYAVIGRSRRWVDDEGNTTMYGLNKDTAERFDHIEGYEDHSLNLLATYDTQGELTGIIVNVPSPAQESMHAFEISADFWCETRQELRARYGEKLYILPQCSAAGELTSALIYEAKSHERMLQLRGRTARQEVAMRIADTVGRILPYIASTVTAEVDLRHQYQTLQLPLNALSEADVEEASNNMEVWQEKYEAEKKRILDNPELKKEPYWYIDLTTAFNRAGWYRRVIERYEQSKTQPNYPSEIHVVRLGEIAFATNPFEYYLDFGIQIKVKSPALQTFIVQLAGSGTYVPSARAAAGGGYGAVPASNPVGSEGGQILADETVQLIHSLWQG
jgi:hypothetical protein